jgi:RES domain
MAGTPPAADFAKAVLEIETVPAGRRFGRIYLGSYPNPLGFGKSPSRFSDPRRHVAANRFGVLYLGASTKVCFLEAVLRDLRDGHVEDFLIAESELTMRRYAEIEVGSDLGLVDLREHRAIRMGVPTDVARASNQSLARQWSVAFHDHPAKPDGITYPSRLDGSTNIAVYGRAVSKLRPVRVVPLLNAPGLAKVLDDLRIGIV